MLIMLGWSEGVGKLLGSHAHDAGLVGGRGQAVEADAHDAWLVVGCGKPTGQLILMMLGWLGAVGKPLDRWCS